MWSEHCSYKSSRPLAARPAADRTPSARRTRSARRGRGRRRRLGGGVQDREPQPSKRHRSLSGRGDRSRRHPPRHHRPWGRARARCSTRSALARSAQPAHDEAPAARHRRWHQRRRLWQRHRRTQRRRPDQITIRRYEAAIRWSTCSPLGLLRQGRRFARQSAPKASATRSSMSGQPPAAMAVLGAALASEALGDPRQQAEKRIQGAGRRSLQWQEAARSVRLLLEANLQSSE